MSLMQAVDRMIQALEAFEDRQATLHEKLDRIESLLQTSKQGLDNWGTEITRVSEQIDRLEASLPDMQEVIQNQEREERLRWRREIDAAKAVTTLIRTM